MKKNLLITLIAAFVAFLPVYATKAPVTIQGKILGLKGRTILLSDINGKNVIAQAKGTKFDTFVIKTNLEIGDGRIYLLNTPSSSTDITPSSSNYIFVESPKIVVNGYVITNSTNIRFTSVTPSNTMREYQRLKLMNDQEGIYAAMIMNYNKQMSAYEANEPGSYEKCQEAVLQLQKEKDILYDSYIQMIPSHPKSNALFAALYSYCDLNNAKACEDWLDKFDPSMKNNYYAQNIIKMANYQKNCEVGKQAPDFSLYDQDGKLLKLSSLKGQNVLLYVWSTWGTSNPKELAILKDLADKYQNKNIKIIGICTKSNKLTWQNNIAIQQFNYTQLFDGGNVIPIRYFNRSTPFTVLINTDGVITNRGLRGEEITKAIAALNL